MATCEQLKEQYEAYALGALEGDERAELEAHLARGCPTCAPEVEHARWLVAQLAFLAPEAERPAALRRRILEAVRPAKAPARRPWIPVWAWAGAAALVLLTIFSVRETRKTQQELAALQEQIRVARGQNVTLESERKLLQDALSIVSAAGTKEIDLKSAQGTLPGVRAYWHAELGLVLSAQTMPAPAPDRTFELWVVPKKGDPVSAGLFRPAPSGQVLMVTQPGAKIGEAAALAITDEPAAGSAKPTTKPMWVGPLS